MAASIKFNFEGELIVIRPHLHTSILHVGDRFAGYLKYTVIKCQAIPDGRLDEKVIQAIAGALERWREENTHLPLETHMRVRDEIRAVYARYK